MDPVPSKTGNTASTGEEEDVSFSDLEDDWGTGLLICNQLLELEGDFMKNTSCYQKTVELTSWRTLAATKKQ
jgi:hypothetical protein